MGYMSECKRTYLYYDNVGNDARRACVTKNIIEEETRIINLEQMKKIVEFFDGKLIFVDDLERSYFKKVNDDLFEIYIGQDVKEDDKIITCLEALGIAFSLKRNKIENAQIIELDKYSHSAELFGIKSFVQAFLMPRKLFEESCINNMNDGKVNVNRVAEDFNIDYMEAIGRGQYLKVWE